MPTRRSPYERIARSETTFQLFRLKRSSRLLGPTASVDMAHLVSVPSMARNVERVLHQHHAHRLARALVHRVGELQLAPLKLERLAA